MFARLKNPDSGDPIALYPITAESLDAWSQDQEPGVRDWITETGFKAKPGAHTIIPDPTGGVGVVLLGVDGLNTPWDWAGLATALPQATYEVAAPLEAPAATAAAFGWALGTYKFDRYKTQKDGADEAPVLLWPAEADRDAVVRETEAVFLCRDLVNTPTNDLGPEELTEAARDLAADYGAKAIIIAGDDLLDKGFPAVHAVGRAAARAPRVVDFSWGPEGAPKVTLVGKGVCFDTGGLDIKPAGAMKLMKKDMGGAAHVLAIAKILMAADVNLRLRVIIPAVENSIAGNAMRPLDVVSTAKGTTIEIGHTDAEGRVILADALWHAVSEKPDLLLDFATLTGAARVALGTELPALFCNDDGLAADILAAGETVKDPLWRLPLWAGYRYLVDGDTADLTNAPEGGYGGAITAALFLEHFVTPGEGAPPPWAHVDVMAWNVRGRAGRPKGGEAMGARAMAHMIRERFGV